MNEIFEVIFPGLMFMWMAFIAQNSMSDIYQEKEKKTLSRLLGSPTALNQILISKIIHCFLLCWIAEVLLILITRFLFGMSWGNLFWQFWVISASNVSIIGILAFLYGLVKTRNLADAITPIIILFSSFLGGSMIPFDQMPPFLKRMSAFSINRWGILGMQNVIQAKSPKEIVLPCVILLGVGLLGILVGVRGMKHRLESGGAV